MTDSAAYTGIKVSTDENVLKSVLEDNGETKIAIWDRPISSEVQECLEGLDIKQLFKDRAASQKQSKLGKYFARFSRASHITLKPMHLNGPMAPLGKELQGLVNAFCEATGTKGQVDAELTIFRPKVKEPEFQFHYDKYPSEKAFVGITTYAFGKNARGGNFEFISKDNEICMEHIENSSAFTMIGDVPVEEMEHGAFGVFNAGYQGSENALIHRGTASKGYRCRFKVSPTFWHLS